MMSRKPIQTSVFSGVQRQPLRNVLIHAPTIIWVDKGQKNLWWHDQELAFSRREWLLVPAGQYLTFVNEPGATEFHSRCLGLLTPPPEEWLLQDEGAISTQTPPSTAVTDSLAWLFEAIFAMPTLSHTAQQQMLFALYAELRSQRALGLLFPSANESLRDRLSRYFAVEPGREHKLEEVSLHFNMSRATMIRKLAAEHTSFRDLLAEVRMVHALSLMQESRSQLDIALACGYQSESRFAARFKLLFGLTPRQYQQTL
ncbi:helix-turn-helix domain-containing protein [Shewanella submarina]|uniref:Helix-turn-helix domain-containing protein n=1 Tax=Shewanella submarina TaxID=2016376 RepID=A0ABV7GAC3_9GAMM|nr:helix-turn-helix domain-containing protein [Shewanella submarina]MCL1039304.1 helix-turn-helix domain-containing protein [Shewanella submarina]